MISQYLSNIFNKPRLLLTLTSLFWACNVVLGRGIVGIVPPITLACLRWTLASLLLLPFAWPYLKREAKILAAHRGTLLFLAIVGPAFYNSLSYLALIWTSALNSLVLNAAGPMFIVLTAWALFGDRPRLEELAGIAAAFLGVLLIIAKGDLLALANFHFNPGDLLVIAGMLCWSVYTACLRLRPKVSWQSYNLVTYAIAAVANVPLAYIERSLGYSMTADWTTAGTIFYAAVFPSLVGYIFYNRAVELLGPGPAGLYLFLVPVFGASFAIALLGEELHAFHAVGFALIIGGVLIGSRSGIMAMRKPH